MNAAYAKQVVHDVATGVSTSTADSLEALLSSGDTLVLRGNNSLATMGNGILLEKSGLTVILDCDANRDGTGMLTSGFKIKTTGANIRVRALFGKNSTGSGGVATEPFNTSNFPSAIKGVFGNTTSYPYYKFAFDLASGDVEMLYLVSSRADMDALRAVLVAGNGPSIGNTNFVGVRIGYALGTNINMGTLAFGSMGGDGSNPFQGVFDGFGFTLSNLKINATTTNFDGLFSYADHASIRNLKLNAPSVQSTGTTGALVGWTRQTQISAVKVIGGNVQGGGVGGLVGFLDSASIIEDCWNSSAVNATGNVGGLAGYTYAGRGNKDMQILRSGNSGAVASTTGNAGGILGDAYYGVHMQDVANSGAVTSTTGTAGGILGYGYVGIRMQDVVNFGSIEGGAAAGIVGFMYGSDTLLYAYNYGNVKGTYAGGLSGSTESIVRYGINYGNVEAINGNAGGIASGVDAYTPEHSYLVNMGLVTAAKAAGGYTHGEARTVRHVLNTGAVLSKATSSASGSAVGIASTGWNVRFSLVSAAITGPWTQAVCYTDKQYSSAYNVYNMELAPLATNPQNRFTPLDHASLRDFSNYPEADSFKANWVAPTLYSIPTPKNLFASGKVFKKLRQDVMALATVTPFTMEHPSTYLPTDGAEWKYSCFGRNSRVNCAVGATDMTISQAYNVTGDEVLVLQATHTTGFVVKDSLLLKLNVARKSEPVVGANWPATLVVEEGKALDLDLSQYFSDADGEAMTYSVSATQVVVSEYANGHVTLLFNKLAGEETLTIQATDAGGRQSPVASVKLVVSTLPKVVTPLSDYVLDKGKIEVVDLSTRFFDADGDALTFTLTGAVNTESSVSGGNLTLVMNSDLGDVLVVSATDNDGHVVRDTLVLASTASPVLALPSHSALAVSVAGSHLQVRSPMAGPATLEIWGSLGDLRWSTPLTLLQGLNETTLPQMQQGQYLVRLRTDAGERTLVWQNR